MRPAVSPERTSPAPVVAARRVDTRTEASGVPPLVLGLALIGLLMTTAAVGYARRRRTVSRAASGAVDPVEAELQELIAEQRARDLSGSEAAAHSGARGT